MNRLAAALITLTCFTYGKNHDPVIGILCDSIEAVQLVAQLSCYGKQLIAIDCNKLITDCVYNKATNNCLGSIADILQEAVNENLLAIITDIEQGIKLCTIVLNTQPLDCEHITKHCNTKFIFVAHEPCTDIASWWAHIQPADLNDNSQIHISCSCRKTLSILANLFYPYKCIHS